MSEPDSILPLPAAVSDPYSVRPHSAEGACVFAADAARLNAEVEFLPLPELAPFPLAASVEPDQRPTRKRRPPWEALALACLAQIVLGAAMAANVVPALFGSLVAVALLICCFCLIVAQVLSEAS